MPYRLLSDESLGGGVRRIAAEQGESALEDLRSPEDPVEAVHDARKRCKKLRGLARLVRPGIGDAYARANRAFRDAARQLSELRDRQAAVETFEDVMAAHPGLGGEAMDDVRRSLEEQAREASDSIVDDDPRLADARHLVERGLEILGGVDLDDDPDDVIAGAAKTHGRARGRFHDAREARHDPEAFHEWRKRVKYGWYHLRLMREAAPSILRPLAGRWHDLSDALGDAHDLHVMAGMLATEPESYGDPDGVIAVRHLLDGARQELESRALGLGARLHAEEPDAFAARLEAYWEVWRRHGPEREAGEIGDLWPVRG